MYLPRPNFNDNASAAEVKRYLVMLVEEIERELERLEAKSNGEDV